MSSEATYYQTKLATDINYLKGVGPQRGNALKKIQLVTCPTLKTQEYILKQNLVSKDKIELLYDPVINVREIQKKRNQKSSIPIQDDYYCAIGRLTKQKNFMFLCKAFKKVINKYPNIRLLIIG